MRLVPEIPAVPDDAAGVRAANARLRELLAERDARIAEQDAVIAVLREQLAGVQSQVADLAARAAANSRNSSKPPSSDGLAKPAPKSLRGKSGRKPGRPKGQPGATMQLSEHPDKTVRHRPARCGCCGKSLKRAAVTAVERRQVIDIPPVKAKTTEHQMLTLLCGCGCETKAQAPDGVTAPVQYGPRLMGTGIYLWHGQFLSRDRACQALSELFGCAPSPGALAAAARKTAGLVAPALKAITKYLISCEVVHFDETGFRTAGKLAWVHSASWGKFVLVTVHAKRGKDGMTAAGVLPFFAGIAVHDAWKPYDTFGNVAGHVLCGAHVLRELVAVTDTGTDLDKAWAQQAIDALLALGKAAEAARQDGKDAIDTKVLAEHEDWYRKAAAAGIALNAGRHGKLQEKRHALATRMQAREDDYLRFARDLRVPFTNNAAEQAIRMSKLRIKISGCMRSMAGAEEFCAIRSYLATAARHGTGTLEALIGAFQGRPWIPETG
ncbi:MAG: IS66 family transposase [Streptosporangiaceae bacterium]|nr:IS66 family transposase [Streptosporangiaceae bacterium]